MVNFQGQYNMDLNTLLFVAGQGRAGIPQVSKTPPNAPLGPCYNYGGVDHWARECPYPQKSTSNKANSAVPTLARYFLKCGIKLLVIGCLLNQDNKGKAPLNSI